MIRKRAFLGLLLLAWLPFIVRAVQIYIAVELSRRRRMLAPTRRDLPRVPRSAGPLRLLRHHLRRRRADRQRPARQRAADLPVEAADARRSTSPASSRSSSSFLLLVTLVPALLLLLLQVAVRRQLRRSCASNLFLFPAITVASLLQVAARRVHDAGAVVAVEERAVRGDPLRRHRLLHRGDLRRAVRRSPGSTPRRRGCRSARTSTQVVDVDLPAEAAVRRRPWSVSLLVIVGAHRACRSRCSSGACAAWRW